MESNSNHTNESPVFVEDAIEDGGFEEELNLDDYPETRAETAEDTGAAWVEGRDANAEEVEKEHYEEGEEYDDSEYEYEDDVEGSEYEDGDYEYEDEAGDDGNTGEGGNYVDNNYDREVVNNNEINRVENNESVGSRAGTISSIRGGNNNRGGTTWNSRDE